MKAFHGSKYEKKFYLNRLKEHRENDTLIQGIRWSKGKGCFVGCILHDYKHERWPEMLGLPVWFAHLNEKIFEELKNEDAQNFAINMFEAIPEGVDIEEVKRPFLIFVLDLVMNTFDNKKLTEILKKVQYLLKDESTTQNDFLTAARDTSDATRTAAIFAGRTAARAACAAGATIADAGAVAEAVNASALASATIAADDKYRDTMKKQAYKLIELCGALDVV